MDKQSYQPEQLQPDQQPENLKQDHLSEVPSSEYDVTTVIHDVQAQAADDEILREQPIVQTYASIPQEDFELADTKPMQTKVVRPSMQINQEHLQKPVLEQVEERWTDDAIYKPQTKKKTKRKKGFPIFGFCMRVILIVGIIMTLIVGAMVVVYAAGDVFGLSESEEKISIEVQPDTTVTEIAEMLSEYGIIEYSTVFRAYLKYMVDEEVIFSYGNFTLTPSMPYEDLIATLQGNTLSTEEVSVTFPEGFTVIEIAERLQQNGVCTKADFLEALNSTEYEYDFLESAYANADGKAYILEGYLYPDTYTFLENSDPVTVITKFLDNFDLKMTSDLEYAIAREGWTIDEFITMASIVQQEAPTESNMIKVASVYWNRLAASDIFPKLQADPTSNYADDLAAEGFDESVYVAYDTYLSNGMPPGAIANPGMDAWESTVFYSTTNYYYFCSDLTTQEFFYAETYEQHQYNLSVAGLTE